MPPFNIRLVYFALLRDGLAMKVIVASIGCFVIKTREGVHGLVAATSYNTWWKRNEWSNANVDTPRISLVLHYMYKICKLSNAMMHLSFMIICHAACAFFSNVISLLFCLYMRLVKISTTSQHQILSKPSKLNSSELLSLWTYYWNRWIMIVWLVQRLRCH